MYHLNEIKTITFATSVCVCHLAGNKNKQQILFTELLPCPGMSYALQAFHLTPVKSSSLSAHPACSTWLNVTAKRHTINLPCPILIHDHSPGMDLGVIRSSCLISSGSQLWLLLALPGGDYKKYWCPNSTQNE